MLCTPGDLIQSLQRDKELVMQDESNNTRFLIALVLSVIVATVYMGYFITPYQQQPGGVQQQGQPQSAVSPAAPEYQQESAVQQQAPDAGLQVQAPPQPAANPSPAQLKEARHIVVENEKFVMTLNLLGGRIESLRLNDYSARQGEDERLNLVQISQNSPLPLAVTQGNISDAFVRYEAQGAEGAVRVPAGGLTVALSGRLPDGREIRKTLRFSPDTYLFDVDVSLSAPDKDGNPVRLEWSRFVPLEQAQQRYDLNQFMALNDQGKLVTVTHDTAAQPQNLGQGTWVAITDQYFMAAIIEASGKGDISVAASGDVFVSRIQGGDAGGKFKVFTGPKVYEDLSRFGYFLEKSVDMGVFSFLAYPILLALRWFHAFMPLHNWGLAIILLTLAIKLLFLPLTSASFKSMRAMQEIQPEVQALRERIEDATKLNQELMALYKRRGVNPIGGCFPIAIQIPVFFGLYNALLNAIELRHAPFALWITDLSAPERLEMFGVGVPLMILIMGASMLIQQWTTPTAMDPAQKKAMLLMPLVFTGMFIVFPMPSGLVLYWLINNIISIVQQAFLRNQKGITPLQATIVSSIAIFVLGYILVLI